jgi:hypothetical protein
VNGEVTKIKHGNHSTKIEAKLVILLVSYKKEKG